MPASFARLLPILALPILLLPAAARAEAEPSPTSADEALYKCGKPEGKNRVSLLPDVDAKQLITWAMSFSCKKFVYTSAIAGRTAKVTMITPGNLTNAEMWGLFEVALQSMGLTLVPRGPVLAVVEAQTAKSEPLAIRRGFPAGGVEVTRLLLRPEHVAVEDLRAALEVVKSRNGAIDALPTLHAILVTDDADHVARMRTLIADLDRPAAGDAVFALPLEHADAATVVASVTSLLGAAPGPAAAGAQAPHFRLVADARTNAVFVAGTPADYARIKALVAAIDVDSGAGASVHRIPLHHATAKDLATTLTGLLGSAPTAAAPRGGDATTGFAPTGPVRVAADEATNALLVVASARDAAALRGLVGELDAPRRQVYIEALVLEVEASATHQLGVSWHGARASADGRSLGFGGLQTGDLSSLQPVTALAASGLVTGLLGPSLGAAASLLGISTPVPSLGLLVRASAHDSHLDVLASPHIMTIDNKEAKLSVGANIPFKTSAGTPATAALPATSALIDRQKVALSLAITPHIAAAEPGDPGDGGESVRLDVKLESRQIGKEDFGDNLGPTWKERTIETSVVLRDQESVVLGGLVDERVEETIDKIPFLGDVPIFGVLFRSTTKVRQKSNLLIVLTPHLIDDTQAGRAVLARRMRERQEFLDAAADLEARALEPHIDYRKKRGLLAEIDQTVHGVERERAILAEANRPHGVREGRIDAPAPEPELPLETVAAPAAPSSSPFPPPLF